MKLPPIRYVRPASEGELLELLATYKGKAKILAGGQSLIPQLAMRQLEPNVVIDINALPDAAVIGHDGDGRVRIGPLVRHQDVARSAIVARDLPLLAQAVRHLGNRSVRNRGTFCGSIAFADPGAEFPACAVALDAMLTLRSLHGERSVCARDFFIGDFRTSIAEDEYLAAVTIAPQGGDDLVFFDEIARRPTGYALAGIASSARHGADANIARLIVFFGIGNQPIVATRTAAAMASKPLQQLSLATLQASLHDDLAGPLTGQPEVGYRLQLAHTLFKRFINKSVQGILHAA